MRISQAPLPPGSDFELTEAVDLTCGSSFFNDLPCRVFTHQGQCLLATILDDVGFIALGKADLRLVPFQLDLDPIDGDFDVLRPGDSGFALLRPRREIA